MSQMSYPLVVENLSVKFGERTIFEGISFSVSAGESLSIVGPSGSGKSTLLSCILGLQQPTAGRVLVGGEQVSGRSRKDTARMRREEIGMVFQSAELIDSLTALENVMLPATYDLRRNDRVGFAAAKDKSRALLDSIGIIDVDTVSVNLSGGERQRVAVARALINDPAIILADEPTGSLDTELRDVAAELLFNSARERNIALVVVTHDPSIAARADNELELTQTREK